MHQIQQTAIKLLTPKQQSILLYFYRFTALTSRHIQSLLIHKNHSQINIWITSLIDQGYLLKINAKINVYILTPFARREIRRLMNKKSIRYPTNLSDTAINKNLYSIQVYLSLVNTYSLKENNFTYLTHVDLLEKKLFRFLSPDGYFTYIRDSGKRHFFVEIDNEGLSSRTIKKKITRYMTYYNSNSWKRMFPNFFPGVCIISQTQERAGKMKKLCEKVIEENNNIPITFVCSSLDQFSFSGTRSLWKVPFHGEAYYI